MEADAYRFGMDNPGMAEIFLAYYLVTAGVFLLVRVFLLRAGPRPDGDRGGDRDEDNLWHLFTRGMNPLLGAVLFPVFWQVVLFLQWFLGRALGGYLASNRSEHRETAFGTRAASELDSRLGREGETLCDLRPSGRVAVAGETLEAVARGCFIHRGRRVTVVGRDGFRVVVEPSD